MRYQITMTSGAQIEVKADDFTVTKKVIDGGIARLKWSGEEFPRLGHIRVGDVAAIVTLGE